MAIMLERRSCMNKNKVLFHNGLGRFIMTAGQLLAQTDLIEIEREMMKRILEYAWNSRLLSTLISFTFVSKASSFKLLFSSYGHISNIGRSFQLKGLRIPQHYYEAGIKDLFHLTTPFFASSHRKPFMSFSWVGGL
uniref:Uncharacterized protein n=1 Tax=Cacopsylla melanoneura TaxID=428564 RepID=A0A8D9BHL7_9HEMI